MKIFYVFNFCVFCAAKQTNSVTNNLSKFWVIDLGLRGLCPITNPLSYAVPGEENYCVFPSLSALMSRGMMWHARLFSCVKAKLWGPALVCFYFQPCHRAFNKQETQFAIAWSTKKVLSRSLHSSGIGIFFMFLLILSIPEPQIRSEDFCQHSHQWFVLCLAGLAHGPCSPQGLHQILDLALPKHGRETVGLSWCVHQKRKRFKANTWKHPFLASLQMSIMV